MHSQHLLQKNSQLLCLLCGFLSKCVKHQLHQSKYSKIQGNSGESEGQPGECKLWNLADPRVADFDPFGGRVVRGQLVSIGWLYIKSSSLTWRAIIEDNRISFPHEPSLWQRILNERYYQERSSRSDGLYKGAYNTILHQHLQRIKWISSNGLKCWWRTCDCRNSYACRNEGWCQCGPGLYYAYFRGS